MKPLYSQINLKVVNNTALPQPVSILGIVPNINSASNSNILYQFNFSGQIYTGVTNVNINISNTSNPTIVVYNAPVTTQSIQGVVDALNSLNQGIFSYSGTTIYVSSSYYIYSNISIAGTSILGTTGTNPVALLVDGLGNVYVANSNSNNVSKITPSGVSTIFASVGNVPSGIVKDSSDNLYTPDAGSNQVSKITSLGVPSIFASTGNVPACITIDTAGNVYTANLGGNNLTKITPLGVATNYGSLSSLTPQSMVIDSAGNVFVCCSANVVRKITPAGVSTNFGVFPFGDILVGIAIDSLDNIYVSNQSNQIIYKLTPSAVQTTYGTSTDNPQFITIDSSSNIYCVNQNGTIDKILATGGTTTISDLTLLGGSGYGIALDTYNNVYVTDYNLNRVYIIVQ
jgi:sugar lactone lactonase YvrE